ncbi:hypothetical protein H9M94_02435 [Mycoplasma sp. Pen4]|uniref:hypothetical protein n=1 Tax=Mycoplasma sp. Pen4 TaxID=640330 RepID=UPI0016541F99|nr:hypothetical protein [Mycoplasma sp. Pen4]QNM93446.1 hypothetical protein H9M94_02435 [Mycoplasma sp. Pen4]
MKIKNKLNYEFRSLRFWLINLVYLVIFATISIAYYATYSDQVFTSKVLFDLFSTATFVTFLISLLSLILKLGFLEKTFTKLKEAMFSVKDSREQRSLNKMSPDEKRAYFLVKEKEQHAIKNKNIKPKTKFPFIFSSILWAIPSIVLLILTFTIQWS